MPSESVAAKNPELLDFAADTTRTPHNAWAITAISRLHGERVETTRVRSSSPLFEQDTQGAFLGATFGPSLAPSSRFAAPDRPTNQLHYWAEVSEYLVGSPAFKGRRDTLLNAPGC